ncbi:MAG: hypothetical protein HFI34_06975 [Lachnospiraceae bacterium]|nr:hypothetical protein [Lachnospiraceae bacterium]
MLKPHEFNSNEHKIQVIASFNTNQEIKPLYFKYNEKTITVLSCTCEKSNISYVFKCLVESEGYTRYVRLCYYIKLCLWTLIT